MGVDVTITDRGCCAPHTVQFTYNYRTMLTVAGMPTAGWKFFDDISVPEVHWLFGRVWVRLHDLADEIRPLELANDGWGTYDQLLESFRELLDNCARHPKGRIHVS